MAGTFAESRAERYDVIVIGAGIGGLTAATLLAKAGKSVLVIERHRRPGGCAHGFSRGRYRFDSGVHLVSGCGAIGFTGGRVIHRILQALELEPNAGFIPVSPYARASYPGFSVDLVSGEDAYVASLSEAFPSQRDGLRRLTRLCRDLAEELMRADDVLAIAGSGLVSPAEALPNLFRYRRATLADVMKTYLDDPRLITAYASLWPYLGLPPSKLSFVTWATMTAGYVYEQGFYHQGSFQRYADLLAKSLRDDGGELLMGASVRRISTRAGRAVGVVLENGQPIESEAVVSNVDLRQTVESLIGPEHLPGAFLENMSRLQPSISVFITYLATDLDLSAESYAHENFFFEACDHEQTFEATAAGHANWFSATIPTLADPSLAPEGEHLMLLTSLCPFDAGDSWRKRKPSFEQRMLDKAERQFPGLNATLGCVESGSPRTVERYTLNHQGAAYGWSPSPEQTGAGRPGVRGPLEGLFLAGHWTRPGGGVTGVSFSGVMAAQAVLGDRDLASFWERFGLASPKPDPDAYK